MKVSLVVLTLNEIDGMKAMMPRLKKEWYDELLIADGGSTDGTIQYAQEHGYPLFVQKDRGAGAALGEATGRVSGDVVVIFCPDGNFIPEKIPLLIDKIRQGCDMAMVSRYRDGAKSYDDDPVTAFGNKMFTGLVNVLFRAGVTDALYGYFAYKKDLVRELEVTTKDNAWGLTLLVRACKKKKKITEIPGDELRRLGGTRKMQPLRDGYYLLCSIAREFFRKAR